MARFGSGGKEVIRVGIEIISGGQVIKTIFVACRRVYILF